MENGKWRKGKEEKDTQRTERKRGPWLVYNLKDTGIGLISVKQSPLSRLLSATTASRSFRWHPKTYLCRTVMYTTPCHCDVFCNYSAVWCYDLSGVYTSAHVRRTCAPYMRDECLHCRTCTAYMHAYEYAWRCQIRRDWSSEFFWDGVGVANVHVQQQL